MKKLILLITILILLGGCDTKKDIKYICERDVFELYTSRTVLVLSHDSKEIKEHYALIIVDVPDDKNAKEIEEEYKVLFPIMTYTINGNQVIGKLDHLAIGDAYVATVEGALKSIEILENNHYGCKVIK